jgi:glycerol-3-phosphate cytidylyltransferase
LESSWEQKTVDIVNYRIDLFVIGDDWVGNFDYLRDFCEVMYLPRTEGISSPLIRGILG